jgi:hypothetical protein
VKHGNIEDLDSLRDGAAKSDGVIHVAFNHDFSQFQKNCDDDRKAIEAMGEVLLGSSRPFVVTSGTAIAANVDGKPSTEDGATASWNPRAAWHCTFMEVELHTPAAPARIFISTDNMVEMIRRGSGFKDLASRQAVEHAIQTGRGT